jgi:hypothetical protein
MVQSLITALGHDVGRAKLTGDKRWDSKNHQTIQNSTVLWSLTRAQLQPKFFGGVCLIENAQTGAIGRYLAQREPEGAANGSVNRKRQILGQMFRLSRR